MKNIKRMALICIAVALVLGATACNSQIPTYKEAVGLTASISKTDYIVGEVFDPSTVSAVAYYSDGSSQALSNTEVSYTVTGTDFSDGKFTAAGDATVTFTYGGATVEKTINGYAVTSVELGNLPETASWTAAGTVSAAKPDTTGVTAVATVNGKKVELPAGSFALTVSVPSAEAGKEKAVTVSAVDVYGESYEVGEDEGNISVTYAEADSWTVTVDKVASDAFDANAPYELEVRYTWSDDENDHYVNETVTWSVWGVNTGSKAEKEFKIADLYFDGVADSNLPKTQTVKLSKTSATTYTVRVKGDAAKTATIVIPNGKDYVTGIEVAVITTGENAIKANSTASISNFKYTITTAANESDETEKAKLWAPDNNRVRIINGNVGAAGSDFKPTLVLTYGKGEGEPVFRTVTAKVPTV